MYYVERRFSVPFGHRLSKHEGRCKNIHGHNMDILVGVKTPMLDKNDMVVDFGVLKKIVEEYIDQWDHCLLLNEVDEPIEVTFEAIGQRCIKFPFDPTAERLAQKLFDEIKVELENRKIEVIMDYVKIYENKNSMATYREE